LDRALPGWEASFSSIVKRYVRRLRARGVPDVIHDLHRDSRRARRRATTAREFGIVVIVLAGIALLAPARKRREQSAPQVTSA
jgi:hypothetical protein